MKRRKKKTGSTYQRKQLPWEEDKKGTDGEAETVFPRSRLNTASNCYYVVSSL